MAAACRTVRQSVRARIMPKSLPRQFNKPGWSRRSVKICQLGYTVMRPWQIGIAACQGINRLAAPGARSGDQG